LLKYFSAKGPGLARRLGRFWRISLSFILTKGVKLWVRVDEAGSKCLARVAVV
jgi:hypothetical protein